MKIPAWKPALALACGLLATATGAAAGNLIYHGGPVIVSAKVVFDLLGAELQQRRFPRLRLRPGAAGLPQPARHQRRLAGPHPVLGDPARRTSAREPRTVRQLDAADQRHRREGAEQGHGLSGEPRVRQQRHLPGRHSQHLLFVERFEHLLRWTEPRLCSYHSSFTNGSSMVKYMILPYPSCSGCQGAGWTTGQDTEHSLLRDPGRRDRPDGNRLVRNAGLEIDQKCAWASPPPITISTICGKAWSNSAPAASDPPRETRAGTGARPPCRGAPQGWNRSDITLTSASQAWFRQGSPNAASSDLSSEKCV